VEPRARIEIRPRPDAHAALARRGSWDGPRSWRIVAHTTQADAPRTLAELQAARPAALWEYRTTDTQKNPPAHLHIPAAVAQLGIVLDLTTQTDATRTTWDREVSGMLMCSDADAMSRRAGSAALYLLRTERSQNPPNAWKPSISEYTSRGVLPILIEWYAQKGGRLRPTDRPWQGFTVEYTPEAGDIGKGRAVSFRGFADEAAARAAAKADAEDRAAHWGGGYEVTIREVKPPRQTNPDEVDAYLQGSRDAQAGKPARMPKDPTLAAAYRQGYEDAADDKRDQKWEEFWGGAAPTREPNAFPKREGVGSGAAQSTSARAYMLTLANLKTSATLRTIAERIHRDDPAIEIDEVIAALRDLEAQGLVKREGPTYRRSTADESKPSRHRNHHDGETADAAATFEAWHRREPSHVDTLDNLPDVIGVYIGRATRIGYRSDKWGKKGHAQDYDHDYTEPGYSPPEVWADRADLDQAHAIVIVGGNQRITPEGID
jgi:hypothetical protein